MRDSESGLEKMSIGHHIQDRGHVMEKKNNKKTREKELNQDFENLDECKTSTHTHTSIDTHRQIDTHTHQ